MTEKNLIRVYTGATSEKRIDIIIKNYTKFIGIVDGYTDGLRYMIECEKESSHRQSAGDLGVRVQTGGMTSNPTARKAINNVITREALINCDFSGNVLDGVDQAEVYIRDEVYETTGYDARNAIYKNGTFIAEDGTDLLALFKEKSKNGAGYELYSKRWLQYAKNGWKKENDLVLKIGFDSSGLYDIGQEKGYGAAQNMWMKGVSQSMFEARV